jgi:tetratricopeptide (TPR) repeat protein
MWIKFVFLALTGWMCVGSTFAQNENENHLANEYFNDGEYEKAVELYKKLHRQSPNVEFYVQRVVDSYLSLQLPDEARDFLEKALKKNPDNVQLNAIVGMLYERGGKLAEAEKHWNQLIGTVKTQNDFVRLASWFTNARKTDLAKATYARGRTLLNNPALFSNELANLYQYENNFEGATIEYLNVYFTNKSQWSYVKAQILRMAKEDNAEAIEKALLTVIQKKPDELEIKELLYEFYLQTNRYADALAQAKALDKLKKESGSRVFALAQTLQNAKEYDLSNTALDYIVKNYKDSPNYQAAMQEIAKNFELKAFSIVPLDLESVRKAVNNYAVLLEQFGRREALSEAMYRKARLQVFYLDDVEGALKELEAIEKLSMPALKKVDARLLIGDIHLMQGDFLQAKEKYLSVENEFKETQTGAAAKFRDAKLCYYKGEFELAKAYLKILKDNTSNNIANDAIQLFLLIQDNTGLDTSEAAMRAFAHAQLTVYRKNYSAALQQLDSLLDRFPHHPLTDDVYWEKAQIYLALGDVENALKYLDKILSDYGDDVRGDDALFVKAEIHEHALKDKKAAHDMYLDLLVKYPSSLFKVEARKRIRRLRGEQGFGS